VFIGEAMIEVRIAYCEDVLQKIASYLASKPYSEVYVFMHLLQTQGKKVDLPMGPSEEG
jgi:hypothetical protein